MPSAKTLRDIQFLEAVNERDIDLLLMEELHVSPEFGAWFAERIFGNRVLPIENTTAWHSINDASLGESDLVFEFQNARHEPCAILVENKVDAPAQPNQGARYRQRGEIGLKEHGWVECKTCIVAPKRYLEGQDDVSNYHAALAYEDIRGWFTDHSGSEQARYKYKAEVLTVAIEQSRRGRLPQHDPQVTQFWHDYWQHSLKEFPELGLKDPGERGPQSTWIYVPNLHIGKGRSLIHKLEAGTVDLVFDAAGDQVGPLIAKYGMVLGKDALIERVGKSAAILIKVSPINVHQEFKDQIDAVREGLRAAYRLQAISRFIQLP